MSLLISLTLCLTFKINISVYIVAYILCIRFHQNYLFLSDSGCIYKMYSHEFASSPLSKLTLEHSPSGLLPCSSNTLNYNLSFFKVKSSTLQISQSCSVLHEQLSSHFFKSSHSLKFLKAFSSFFTASRFPKSESLTSFGNCYPVCHMNTS